MRWSFSRSRTAYGVFLLGAAMFVLALWNLEGFNYFSSTPSKTHRLELHAFYNLFWNGGTPRIAHEQLSWLESSGIRVDALHVFGFGSNLSGLRKIEEWTSSPVVYEELSRSGNEEVTLAALHRFCSAAVLEGKEVYVLYFHPKGSFHPSTRNEKYRQAVGHYVLRRPDGCLNAMAYGHCDACGLRFSEYPHAHFPGNMWWANCSYVSRLYPPDIPRTELKDVQLPDYCVGVGRFASEHWIGSHPLIRPCDCFPVLEDAFYWYGFGGLDDVHRLMVNTMDCRLGPRPNLLEVAAKLKMSHALDINLRCRQATAEGDRRAYGLENRTG
ncbi:hypothetical protein CCYA_CCYA04G1246 [Cyanidiococcus yangmingshanensis]|nr:hypothetical protein CCYA_CCYA04G1246 [Cyanidiococcus yangmingshanensis]